MFDKAITELKNMGIKVADGLAIEEVNKAEETYGIKFHPDHSKLLQAGLLMGDKGYNWRDFSKNNVSKIKKMLDWPLEGILFDIENNVFWLDELGEKPGDLALAKEKFSVWFKQNVPQLIPIYSHRYMSNEPVKTGAPVYSVYQTDIIYYGKNVFKYLEKEFDTTVNKYSEWEKDNTPFWSEIVS